LDLQRYNIGIASFRIYISSFHCDLRESVLRQDRKNLQHGEDTERGETRKGDGYLDIFDDRSRRNVYRGLAVAGNAAEDAAKGGHDEYLSRWTKCRWRNGDGKYRRPGRLAFPPAVEFYIRLRNLCVRDVARPEAAVEANLRGNAAETPQEHASRLSIDNFLERDHRVLPAQGRPGLRSRARARPRAPFPEGERN